MTYRILTVCHGNICRSPMAQIVLSHHLRAAGLDEATSVDSCGLSNEEEGNTIDPRARTVLERHGYQVPPHRARRIERGEVDQQDLVLASTFRHYRALTAMAHDGGGQVAMIRSFDPALRGQAPGTQLDLDDPWYGNLRDFEDALAQIEAAMPGVVARIAEEVDQ